MTFYLDTAGTDLKPGETILRTQTSAMQGRIMEKMKPPFRVLAPGRNFRYEQVDASHGFEFWQVEGFVVDENIHLTDLFGTINYVLRQLFGKETKIRFATTNFPFVEPGVDAYLQCTICGGKGCSFCKGTGWSEIMPAGMIHPNVLRMAKIDPAKWNGFAFAIGLSRIVNLRYQIKDLRTLTTPDMRILSQF
jgi:phenylalanyl-tRNA synthetase alpha chain